MEYSGFFNGDQEYGQDEFNRYFDNIYESGVSVKADNAMTLGVINEGNTIIVESGFAIIKGFYLYNDNNKSLTVTADSNYDRIDRVVVRLNISTSKVSIEIKKGLAGSKPQPPSLQRDNLIYELSLSQIYIPRSGNVVLIDERYRNELCGAIRPKNLSEFNSMIKGFTVQFDKWFDSQQSKGWRNTFIQPERPVESVSGSIWIQTLT